MRRKVIIAALGAAVLAVLFVVGASANLAGSTFEGNDGNLVVNTAGNHDWANAVNLAVGTDLPTGTGDNSFGQGDKEDDPNVHVGFGSIPNSKADLAQFYVSGEQVGSNVFLYLGWTRANDGGTTNFDFEINQKAQPNLTVAGATTLVRTTGDLLVNYLFQGSGTPQVAIRTWTGSAWSAPVDASSFSEAAINSGGAVANPIAGGNTAQNRFGEAAINLTAGGIIPPGVCESFTSAFVKSRSSTSFTSEIKDFIAPVPVSLNNCATIVVKKVTVPSPDPTSTAFPFVSSYNGNFSLKDGESNTKTGLNPGSGYSVSETVPANWALTSFTCDDGSLPSAINLSAGETVTCTATNTLQQGAIKVTKTTKVPGKTGPQPQAGVNFTVNGSTKATGADGTVCFDGLNFGAYDVTETVPTGYKADGATTKSVNVSAVGTCSSGTQAAVSFSNSPLTDVTISVDSKADGGTASTVNCDDNSLDFTTGANGDGTKTSDAVAGSKVITCTITIDP